MSATLATCTYSMTQDKRGSIHMTCKTETSPIQFVNEHKFCHKTQECDSVEENTNKSTEVIMIKEDVSLIRKNLQCQSFPGSCATSTMATPLIQKNQNDGKYNISFASSVNQVLSTRPDGQNNFSLMQSIGAAPGSPVFTQCWRMKPSLLASANYTHCVNEFTTYAAKLILPVWCGIYLRIQPKNLINEVELKNLYPKLNVPKLVKKYGESFEITNKYSLYMADSEKMSSANGSEVVTKKPLPPSHNKSDDLVYNSKIHVQEQTDDIIKNCKQIILNYKSKYPAKITFSEKSESQEKTCNSEYHDSAEIVGAHGNSFKTEYQMFGEANSDSENDTIRNCEKDAFKIKNQNEDQECSNFDSIYFSGDEKKREILSIMCCPEKVCIFVFDQMIDVTQYFGVSDPNDSKSNSNSINLSNNNNSEKINVNSLQSRKISAADLRFGQCSVIRYNQKECRFMFYETFYDSNTKSVSSRFLVLQAIACEKSEQNEKNIYDAINESHTDSIFETQLDEKKVDSSEVLPDVCIIDHSFTINDSVKRAIIMKNEVIYVNNTSSEEHYYQLLF